MRSDRCLAPRCARKFEGSPYIEWVASAPILTLYLIAEELNKALEGDSFKMSALGSESRDARLVSLLASHFQDLIRALSLGLNADAI